MSNLPMSPRLAATEQRYQDDKAANRTVGLHAEPAIKGGEYKYFKIIANRYPYDAIARTHHMLVIKRECAGPADMTAEELRELEAIKFAQFYKYHCVIENYQAKSIAAIWHVHLLNYYEQRPEWLNLQRHNDGNHNWQQQPDGSQRCICGATAPF